MRLQPFATAVLLGLFIVGLSVPAEARRGQKVELPASVKADGELAKYIAAIEDMNKKERRAYRAGLSEEERQALDAEFRALPEQERKALTKALRKNAPKLRAPEDKLRQAEEKAEQPTEG